MTKIPTDSYFLHSPINLECSQGRDLEGNTLQKSPFLVLPVSPSQAPTPAFHVITPATLWSYEFQYVGGSWQGPKGITHFAFS